MMRRYAYAYTASHDFAVCDEIMVPDYTLRMGPHVLRGRDAYEAATARQFEQYPGLGFTVHSVVSNGERLAMHFTEHGWAVGRGLAAWSGISAYRWDGHRLTECIVEQDYYSRRRQMAGVPNPVQSPGWDPWTAALEPAEEVVTATVRGWLESGGLVLCPQGALDDEWCAPGTRVLLDGPVVKIHDLWSAGRCAAFHIEVVGRYSGCLPELAEADVGGAVVTIYASGLAEVVAGQVVSVRAVTDRLGVLRQLQG